MQKVARCKIIPHEKAQKIANCRAFENFINSLVLKSLKLTSISV